jgi:hypothetical protein
MQEGPTFIMCDNQGYIALTKNPTLHSPPKSIDTQYHFITEKLENQELYLKFCSTKDMIVDVLTKSLAKKWHQALTKAMDFRSL